MRITVRLTNQQQEQLDSLKGKTTSDKLRSAIKLAYLHKEKQEPQKVSR